MPDLYIAPDAEKETPVKKDELANPSDVAPWQRPGKHLPFLASYCFQPEGVTFTNQEEGEYIVLFLRRHMVTNFNWISISLLLFLFPPLFSVIYTFISPYIPIPTIQFNFFLIFLLFYYLVITGYTFVQFISWFYNVGIISNKRIIDIDFKDIMYREVATARIEDVIDVEFHQGGFMHSFFDYGDIFIQTQGFKPNFEFHSIPHTDKVTDIILDLKGKMEHAEQ